MWLVILSKAITAVLLAAAFVVLIISGEKGPRGVLKALLAAMLALNAPDSVTGYVVANTAALAGAKAFRLAAATLAYSILETAEASGLAARKLWAEWLTI